MKQNSREAWLGTVAALVVMGSSLWEGFASLLFSLLIMIAFTTYKNSHSSLRWQLRLVIYIVLALIAGLIDWGAIRAIASEQNSAYWSYIVLGVTLVLVYLTTMWEQHRGRSGHK